MIPCEPELGVLSLGRWNMLAVVFWLLLLKIVTSGIKRGAISIWTFQRVTTSGYDLTTSTRDWMYPSIFTSPRLTHCNRVRYSLREVNLVLIMGEEMIEGWGGSFTAAKGKSWRKSFLESEWHCGGPSSVHGQTRGELISQPKLPEMVRVIARNRTVLVFDRQNLILSPNLSEETEVLLYLRRTSENINYTTNRNLNKTTIIPWKWFRIWRAHLSAIFIYIGIIVGVLIVSRASQRFPKTTGTALH